MWEIGHIFESPSWIGQGNHPNLVGGDVIDQWMKVRVMEPHLRPILSLLEEYGEWRHGA